MRLGKPAANIDLGAVVRRTEPDMDLVACFGDAGRCPIDGACVLSAALAGVCLTPDPALATALARGSINSAHSCA